MKVLITGSSGFLGRAVAARLVADGHEVTAGTRRSERLRGLNCVPLDVTDRESVRSAVLGSRCDAVVHLAGLTRMRDSAARPLAFYDVNTTGTLNVMHAVDELGPDKSPVPQVVFASTGAVYGSHPTVPLREVDPVQAENPYAGSKLASEQLIEHHARSGRSVATILRFSNIAGGVHNIYDDDGDHIIPRVLTAIRDSTSITINGDGGTTRDFVHVVDAAEATRLALLNPPAAGSIVLNIGSGVETAVRTIVAAAEQATGKVAHKEHRAAGAEAQRVVMQIDRAFEHLGWKPNHTSADQIVADAWKAAQRP